MKPEFQRVEFVVLMRARFPLLRSWRPEQDAPDVPELQICRKDELVIADESLRINRTAHVNNNNNKIELAIEKKL